MSKVNWWNNKTIPIAGNLWKPGIHTLSNKTIDTNSWYKASVQSHSKIGNVTNYENKEIKEFNITRKIKMNPTKEQRDKLTEWWHAYRYTYNKAVQEIGKNAVYQNIQLDLRVNKENKVKVEIGTRFEMERSWKLDLKYILEPKIKLKLRKLKNGTYKTKIEIINDPAIRPVRVNIHFEYPKVDSWYDLRNKFVTYKLHKNPEELLEFQNMTNLEIKQANIKSMFKEERWLQNVDKRIRAGAAKDARSAYETISTLAKDYNKKGTMGPLPFKRKKYGQSWTISMEKSCIEPILVERRTIGRKKKKRKKPIHIEAFYVCPAQLKTPILCYERIPEVFGDPKIHKDKWGDWWLLLPIKKTENIKNTKKPGIALDPGVATAFVGYSDNGNIYNYVENENTLMKTLKSISAFQGMIDCNDTAKKRKAKLLNKLRKKIQNKVSDMHWKVINSLCSNHNLIVIGKFNVQSVLRSDTITKYTKRKLQALSHYKLKTRLIYKAAALGVKVKVQNEWGTTIGCPCCGRINRLTLSDRIYKCPCDYVARRDDKSACCIMLKHLAGVW